MNRNMDAFVTGPRGELRLGGFDWCVDDEEVAGWVVYCEDERSFLHRVFACFSEAFEFARKWVGAS
jgi:hypothetical protein